MTNLLGRYMFKCMYQCCGSDRGQSYKTFYILGQIYKLVLKLDESALIQKILSENFRTLQPKVFTE